MSGKPLDKLSSPPIAVQVLAVAMLFLGMGMLLLSMAVWLRFHVQVPVRDLVPLLPLVKSGVVDGWQSISLSEWLDTISNAHRIAVTRLLMLADYSFLGGKNYTIYLSAWLSIALLLFIYWKAARSQRTQDRFGHYFVAGVSLIFLCSPSQYLNLINPVNASWYVAMASSAASVWILVSAGSRLNPGSLILVCLFAAIAAFSNFSGVLACLVIPVVALYQRSRLSVLVLVFSAVFVFLYLRGIASDDPGTAEFQKLLQAKLESTTAENSELRDMLESPDSWLPRLEKVTRNTILHLGAPFSSKYPFFTSPVVLGSVLFIVYQWLLLGINWYLRKEPAPKAVLFYLAMATICLGISCSAWLGRSLLVEPMAPRYQTISMVYWLSMICLIFSRAQCSGNKRRYVCILFALGLVSLLPILAPTDSVVRSVVKIHTTANNVQIMGQLGWNYLERSGDTYAKIYTPYFSDYAEFLSDYGFEPLRSRADSLRGVSADERLCDGTRISKGASRWPGVQKISLNFDFNVSPLMNRLYLFGNNGGIGMLYRQPSAANQLRSTLLDSRQWTGFYQGDIGKSLPVTLMTSSIPGRRHHCGLHEQNLQG